MHFHIHHHYPQVEDRLRQMDCKLDLIQELIMASVSENIDNIEASVKSNNDLTDSIITVLGAIRADVAALKASGTDPSTAARIEALAASIAARTPVLAAAAIESTPAA